MVFKLDHIFGNNGARPSLGGVTLAGALQRVEAAEQALSAARSAARAAAKAEGKSTRHLFDGHPYVARSSAERWCDEARSEGWRAGATFFADAVESLRNPDPKSEYYHLAMRLNRTGLPPLTEMLAAVSGEVPDKGAAIVRAAARARMSADAAGEVPEPTGLAAQIIAAGKKARRPTGSDE
jgi:hypothetical protein